MNTVPSNKTKEGKSSQINITTDATLAQDDNSIKAFENQQIMFMQSATTSGNRLSMRLQERRSTKPEFKELSHQVARYRAASVRVPTLAAATSLPNRGNYQVNIEGNTQFEQSLNYLDKIFADQAASGSSFLQRASQNIFQAQIARYGGKTAKLPEQQ